MWHFELTSDTIYAVNSILQGSAFSESEVWGIRLGGKWVLDYTWKLSFGIPEEEWNNRCGNLRTNKDFYDLCEWLGIFYMKDNIIYRKGEKYDKMGNKL